MKRYVPLLAWLVVGGVPSQSLAQKVGPEFRVNTYTTGYQRQPSVASDANGNFIVVWSSPQDGSGNGVFGQRYDSGGNFLGDEFQVNTYTTNSQGDPSIASDPNGNFIVVWSGTGQGDVEGIFGQRYDSGGNPLGEFQVNAYTTKSQALPRIASDAVGNFVVIWTGASQYDDFGIVGQRYDNSGNPLGGTFQVSNRGGGGFSVASDANGNFVVVWGNDHYDGGLYDIWGRRYDSGGHPLGGEFRVNTDTKDYQDSPAVASGANGNFVVVWRTWFPARHSRGIFGQRYDSDGNPLGGEFKVNTDGPSSSFFPSVASDASGNFVVVWESPFLDGDSYGVFGERYDSSGHRLGGQFQVNTYTTAYQDRPSVASDAIGNFVVVWESGDASYGGDYDYDIFGQRFIAPPSLSIADVSVNEGNLASSTGVAQVLFTVTLSAPSNDPVSVDYATADGTATTPSDYLARSGTLIFQPGEISKVVTVSVKGDTEVEEDETFFLNLGNPIHGIIGDGQGLGTIVNDDP